MKSDTDYNIDDKTKASKAIKNILQSCKLSDKKNKTFVIPNRTQWQLQNLF